MKKMIIALGFLFLLVSMPEVAITQNESIQKSISKSSVILANKGQIARSRNFYDAYPHWEYINGILPIPVNDAWGGLRSFILDPFDPINHAWVGIEGSIWYTENLDDSIPLWKELLNSDEIFAETNLYQPRVLRIEASTLQPGLIFVAISGYEGGPWKPAESTIGRSENYGFSWTWSNKLGPNYGALGFELSHHNVNRLWVGSSIPGKIWMSNDGGRTFSVIYKFSNAWYQPKDIFIPEGSNEDDKMIYAIVDVAPHRLYRSLDGGYNWHDITYNDKCPRGNYNIIGGGNFEMSDIFYISGSFNGPWQFIYSTDGGITFQERFITSQPMSAAWQDPIDGHFYTARAASSLSSSEPVAFYSNDGGYNWQNKTGDWYQVVGFPYLGEPGSSGGEAPVFIFDSYKYRADLAGAPNDGGDYASNEINFTWAQRRGANFYRLDLATDTTETSIVDRVNVGNVLSYTYNKNLIEDVTYYARIAASNDSGLTFQNFSQFSDGITIDRTPPTIYTPTGRLLDDQRVQFVFKATDKHLLARYHIQVATDLSFQTPAIEKEIGADGIFTFTGTPGLTYYARAYAIDGASNQSGYSEASNGVSLAPLPDLQVTQVQVPPEAWSGQALEISWVVTNKGQGSTRAPEWLDRVYLSADTLFNSDIAQPLDSVRNISYLNPGESYMAHTKLRIPQGMAGSYYAFVFTDAGDQQPESDGSNNVGRSLSLLQIRLTPPPDLQVVSFIAPDNAFSGQSIPISWTIKNAGNGKTEAFEWSDAAYLSQDSIFNAQHDKKLGAFAHSGSLPPDSVYQNFQTVKLPQAIYGTYFLFMVADAENQVYEHAWELNNTSVKKIMITLSPPPDLVVTEVIAPTHARSGETITLDWYVQNQGPGAPFEDSWNDRVWLSKSQQFHADSAIVLGTFSHFGQLQPDSSYHAQHSITLPNGITGSYYIFVKTDWNNQVFEHQFEENNLKRSQQAVQIDLSPWPDLQVIKIETPTEAVAGSEISIRWTVKNAGKAVASAALWKDRIYISSSMGWRADISRQLSEVTHSQPLDTTQTYSKNISALLPADISGRLYIHVFTDAGNSVYEHTDEANNISRSDSIIVQPYPSVDLAITDISVPDSGWSGQTIIVSWTTVNAGAARTLVSDWHDGVYLSSDSLLDVKNDQLLKRVRRTASLAAGENYTRQVDIVLPNGIVGLFYLFIVADIDDRVKETNDSNNIRRTALKVFLTLSPDLALNLLDVPAESNSGQPIMVRWRVKNLGTGATPNITWYDAIYFSTDSRLDQTDLKLGTLSRQAVFMPSTTYSESLMVELPNYASGVYFIIVKTDSKDEIYEHGSEANNLSAQLITLTLPPPADLIVANVTIPSNAIPGEQVSISWTIKNIGQNPAVGWIYDGIYVSFDSIWQANDPLVGIDSRYINLAPGISKTFNFAISLAKAFIANDEGQITEQLPGITPRKYHIIVRTNIRSNIRESDLTNNALASKSTIEVTVPLLQLGVMEQGTLTSNQMKYYRVEVGDLLNLQVNLTSDVKDACNGVYVAFNRVPTLADFDYAHLKPLSADQKVLVPSTQRGNYYILIHAEKLPASIQMENYTVLVEALPFSIFSVTPNRGGQNGRVTGKILGAGFEQPIEVFLRDSLGGVKAAEVSDLINSTEMIVRWDLKELPLGIYDVIVKKSDTLAIELAHAFTVEPPMTDHIFTDVQGPEVLPGGRNAVYEIFVTNANNVDADYIFLTIAVPAYQKFELKTTDFFGRPIPENIMNRLEYPMATRRIGDIALLVCAAKDVPAGKTLHATLLLYNINGPAHSSTAIFIKAYPLSLEEFVWREMVALFMMREEILAADASVLPAGIRELLAPEDGAGLYIYSLKSSGLVGTERIIMPTMPLRYDPSHFKTQIPFFMNCDLFAKNVEAVVDYSFTLLSIVDIASDWAFLTLIGVGPEVAMLFLAAETGFMLYDLYETSCSNVGNCPDWVSELKVYKDIGESIFDLLDIFIDPTEGIKSFLLSEGSQWLAKNVASIYCKEVIYAHDPNNIIGPAGFGNEKWVSFNRQLGYRINFENDSTLATAPAQAVTITHQLDATVDPRSFRLGNFGFGNFNLSIPGNRSFYTERLDVRDSLGLFVDVNFGIDVTTNKAFWYFKSIDPFTGQLPTNPFSGFLLVNDRLGRGQGFVSFSVRPRSDVRTRNMIHARAKIIFDQNEPIETPEIFNTIDAVAPTSRVKNFQALKVDTSLFAVHWSGWDDINGSGIGRFALYVAEDEKPFRLYQAGIQDTSLYFSGEMGHDYQFFSIAIDNAGNIEPIKTAGEAKVHTSISKDDLASLPNKFALHQNYPNPFNPITTIRYELPEATRVELVIYNILGQKVKELVNEDQIAGVYSIIWDGRNQEGLPVASGIYLYRIRTPQFNQTKKMLMLK